MKIKSIIILVFLVSSAVKAQIPIKVENSDFALTETKYKGLKVNIPEVFYVNVKKSWVKNLESGTKSEIAEDRDGEISIFGANIKEISSEPVNVYSQIMSGDSVINLSVAIEIKRGQFISGENDKESYNKFKAYLFDFAKDEYLEKVKADVKEEEKKLSDIERELTKLQNQKKKLNGDIEQSKQGIADSEDALKILDSESNLNKDEITNLEANLESETDNVVKTDLEEKLKQANKEKRKIASSIEKEKNKITENKNSIETAKEEIKNNVTLQETFPEKIQAQQKVVDFHKNKLLAIENF